MNWGALVLVLVGSYATAKLVSMARREESYKYAGLAAAGILFVITQLGVLVQSTTADSITALSLISEWGHILSLAFVLSALAIFIRDSKPVFAQFPLIYTALPVLIVLSYFMVIDTYALKNWLVSIYQGGAIVVGILMYSVYWYRKEIYVIVFAGTILLLIAYVLYWFVPPVGTNYPWIWQLVLSAGILTLVTGYENVLRITRSEKRATLE